MDESVLRAMARWPDVPDVFGWLALDRRGRWLLKGEPIGNRAAVAFIGRNYDVDGKGRWFFQNGPQRVFVDLDYTPWVLRLQPDGRLYTHTGSDPGVPHAVLVDEAGAVVLGIERGAGLLDDRELDAFSGLLCDAGGAPLDEDAIGERLERLAAGETADLAARVAGVLRRLDFVASRQVPERFGFVRRPSSYQKA